MSSGTVQKLRTFKADLEAAREELQKSGSVTAEDTISPPKEDSSSTTQVEKMVTATVPQKEEPEPAIKPDESSSKEVVFSPAPAPVPEPMIISKKDTESPGFAPIKKEPTSEPPNKLEPIPESEIPNFSDVTQRSQSRTFDEDIEGGTIVSNKRVGGYSLWRAFKDNVNNWQQRRRDNKAAELAAQPTVTAAESRIETLKKAAASSYRAPQSDHGILLKQLKKRAPQAELPKSNIVIKKKEEVAAPQWKHVIEDEEELGEKPGPSEATTEKIAPLPAVKTNVSEKVEESVEPSITEIDTPTTKPMPAETVPPQPSLEPAVYGKPIVSQQPRVIEEIVAPSRPLEEVPQKPKPSPAQQTPPAEEKKITPKPISVYQWPTHTGLTAKEKLPAVEPIKKPDPITPPQTPSEPISETPVAPPEPKTKPIPIARPAQKESSSRPSRSWAVVMAAIVLVVMTGAGGWALWTFWWQPLKSENVEVAVSSPTQQLIASEIDYPVAIDQTIDDIFASIYEHMVGSRSLTTHSFVTTDNVLADPNSVVATLGLRLTGSFARSLTGITIGSLDGTEPFIIMRSTNFDTAFAGMLAWENSLSIDVALLFGTPVSESFDPNARTDTQVRPAFYKDDIVANTSVRILRDSSNTSRITYGFADPNTIVITTNETAYELLLQKLR